MSGSGPKRRAQPSPVVSCSGVHAGCNAQAAAHTQITDCQVTVNQNIQPEPDNVQSCSPVIYWKVFFCQNSFCLSDIHMSLATRLRNHHQCYVPLIQNTTWTLDACDAMLINRSLLLLVKHKGLSFKTKHTTRHLQSVLWGGAADRVQSVCRVCGKDEMRQRFLYRLNARSCSRQFAFQNKVRQN